MMRLERLETDVSEIKGTLVQIANILVGHSDRMDAMQRSMDAMQQSMSAMQQSMSAMQQGMQSVVGRLDRLIEVTIRDRTQGVERMGDVERRLARLEEHVGIPRA